MTTGSGKATKEAKRSLSNPHEALDALYGGEVADFTPEVLLEAFRELRRSDPAKARQAQRLLSPQLDKVFPRRLRDWTMSSAGTRARLALLSENPHFLTDVAAVRELI